MSKLPLLIAMLLVAPAPALAQIIFEEPAPRHLPPRAHAKTDLDKLECRAEDMTGSRLKSHQVCLTKQQWWSYEMEAKQRLQELQVIGYTSR